MAFSSGAFTRTNGTNSGSTLWNADKVAGTKITSSNHDTHDQDLADGINATMMKAGTNFHATSSGTNVVVVTLTPAATAYTAGQLITFKAGGTCTGAVTVNVNSLGAKAVQKLGAALVAGDITANNIVTIVYDGTQFQMVSPAKTPVLSGNLSDIAALAVTDSAMIVGDGSNYVLESGATLRTSIGVGTGDSPQFTNVTLTGDIVSLSNADVDIAPHGTGNVVLKTDLVSLGGGSEIGHISSNGAYDMKISSNSGTNSGTIVITDAADGAITFAPNGTGVVSVGSGSATGHLSSNGAYDMQISSNSGTNSGTITITDAANGAITLTPNGTGIVDIQGSMNSSISTTGKALVFGF